MDHPHTPTIIRRPKNRALAGTAGVAGLALILAACGSNSDGGAEGGTGELIIAGFGGAYGDAQTEAYYDEYPEISGVNLEVLSAEATLGAVSVQVENENVLWDIVELNGADMVAGCLAGILEPIDYDVVDRELLEENVDEECGVAASVYTVGIGYDPEDWPEPPSWEDFYDTASYPGSRAIESYIQDGTLEYALLGDGVNKDDLYPLDLDRAVDTLLGVADDLIVVDSLAQASQLLTSGDAVMIQTASARMLALQEEGFEYEYHAVGQTGGSFWAVPQGAPNKEEAMAFLAWAAECVECTTLLGELTAYSGPNAEGNTHVTGDVADLLPSNPDVMEISFPVDLEWWGDNTEEAQDAFNRFMTSQG